MRIRYYGALAIADIAAILIGIAAATLAKHGPSFPDYVYSFAIALPILFSFVASSAYSAQMLGNWKKGAMQALTALAIAFFLMLFVLFALKSIETISRVWMVLAFGLSAMFMVGFRAIIGRMAAARFRTGTWRVLLVSDGIDIAVPANVRRLDVSAVTFGEAGPHPLMLDEIGRCAVDYDSIVICSVADRRQAWAYALHGSDVPVHILIPELNDLGALDMEQFEGIPMICVSLGQLKVRSRLAKRALDLGLTVPLLIAVAPLMAAVAIAIRLESPGPILFRQKRVGYGNRLFNVYKFRSMFHDQADGQGARSTGRDDDRVTRVGRFIRATSIDELPQLFNVLVGDMSLVGPRPHALGSVAGDKLFWELDSRYHARHACKPGLTGLAQVRGFRGATEKREDLLKRLDADLEYRASWSVWRDISILLATVKVVVHRNAF